MKTITVKQLMDSVDMTSDGSITCFLVKGNEERGIEGLEVVSIQGTIVLGIHMGKAILTEGEFREQVNRLVTLGIIKLDTQVGVFKGRGLCPITVIARKD